jgi:hypothetical protein
LRVAGQQRGRSTDARRDLATRISRAAALVTLALALVALVINGDDQGSSPSTTKTVTREEAATEGNSPDETKLVTQTKTETPGDDRSLVGRAFSNDATPYLFEALLAALVAFTVGAFVQRILLGAYGITIGPITVPELAPIDSEEADRAVSKITDSPAIGRLLGPGPRGPQPLPQYLRIDGERMSLLSYRVELEVVLRDLADALGLDRDVPLARVPNRLATAGVIDGEAATGLEGVLEIGDQIAEGASYTPEVATKLLESAAEILYALRELGRRRADHDRSS